MPWQRLVADVGGELLEDGTPAYREVIVTVPRQSGKTTLVMAFMVDRALNWGARTRVAYTMQNGAEARAKLLNDMAPMVTGSALDAAVTRVLRAAGDEAIIWRNGSRIEVQRTAESSGHGRTLDLGVLDEAWHDDDDRREQAMLPAMLTKRSAQLLIPSTAGHAASSYFRRKVELGRAATAADSGFGVAYFEWSAGDDVDPDDESERHRYMPALGHTQGMDAVRHARLTMSDGEYRRAMMNQWVEGDERVIPESVWLAALDDTAAVADPVFAVDGARDMASAAVAAADGSGLAELVDYRDGVGWLLDRCRELHGRWGGGVAVDPGGPVGWLAGELEAAGVPVRRLKNDEQLGAHAWFLQGLADGQVRVRPASVLHETAGKVSRRWVGERWVWDRKGSQVDVSPIGAVMLAAWSATHPDRASQAGILSL